MRSLKNIRRGTMLTCEDVNTFLVSYLEGELDEHTRQRFRSHIADCGCCHAFLEQYEEVMELARENACDEETEVPDELAERTVAFLRANIEQNHD